MIKKLFLLRFILIVGMSSILSLTATADDNKWPNPEIKSGTAKISGSISNLKTTEGKEVVVKISAFSPLTGESLYPAKVDKNNQFSIDVPLESTPALVMFSVWSDKGDFYGNGSIALEQDKTTQMDLVFEDKGGLRVDAKGAFNLNSDDAVNITEAIKRFEQIRIWGDYYKMTPDQFAQNEINISLKGRNAKAIDSLSLTDNTKDYLINSFNLKYLNGRLFDYKNTANESFRAAKIDSIKYTAEEPNQSYYSFLEKFNLNNPQYLYCYTYSGFMKSFLSIKAFNIPNIKETSVEVWLNGVKNSVKQRVGFDSGLFYDMLAAHAYDFQLTAYKEPFTKKQIENLKTYFQNKNNSIMTILLNKNTEIVKMIQSNSDLKVNKTPAVAKEKLMDEIISKYKGKVVFVDFWATWCAPCKSSFAEMSTIKKELKEKVVVFVYVTTDTSPKEKWGGEIKGIGGEHYYISSAEWNYIGESLDFKGVPSYLLYDKNGKLIKKYTGFPGIKEIKSVISEISR